MATLLHSVCGANRLRKVVIRSRFAVYSRCLRTTSLLCYVSRMYENVPCSQVAKVKHMCGPGDEGRAHLHHTWDSLLVW